MPLVGRGNYYSRARGAVEWALVRAYRGGWPGALVHAAGLQLPLRVVRHRITLAKWPKGCPPLRIAFASDLHAGPTTHPSLLDAAVSAIASESPDILLLGGDYVFLTSDGIGDVASRITTINAPFGRFGVFGNHDLWADDRAIKDSLEHAGVRMMINESLRLPAPYDRVALIGLDDPWTGDRDAASAFRGVDAEIRIVLMHAPESLLLLDEHPFDVAVCGHTHGGHIALPIRGGWPIIAPGALSRRYAHGRFDVGDGRTMMVSRGVGSTESPFRWNANPDVLVIDLCPS